MQLDAQQRTDSVNIKIRSDDAQSADDACRTRADVGLTGNVVKVDPVAVVPCYDALGA